MNALLKPAAAAAMHPDEWQTRVQLAACYRIFDMLGWTEMIYNHITVRLPDSVTHGEKQFLINPFGLHYAEVTASKLLKIDLQGNKLDAANPWPASYTDIASVDADGDGSPGLTAVPRNGNGFVQPPTGNLINRVDRLYLALRNTMLIMSTRSGCDTASGTATFSHFDNHVVGCHVSGGQNCGATDVALVDLNRTAYQVTSATIQSKIVADAATCTDVRAALPIN